MNKAYDRIYFHNGTTPALNESNLNAMSKGIDDIDTRVVELAGNILETIPQIQAYLEQAQDIEEALEQLSQNPPYIGENGNWYVWDTNTSEYVDSGIDASITVAIADITMLAPDATPYVTNTGTDTDPIFHLFIPRAAGISSITKTSSAGLVDTYTITFENGTTTTFTVTNGENGHTIYDSAGVAMTQRQKLKFDGGLNVSDNVDTTVVTYGKWTQAVSCLVGDTSCTITDAAITTNCTILSCECDTASGKPVGWKTITVTAGKAVVNFSSALTEAAQIKLLILN
jgi:hypothetical protein